MAGYIRQDTTNNIADGNVINASDFDNEYNAIEAAFHATTGHTHDGTSAEGAPITKIGPTQDVVASTTALTPKTDNTVDLGSPTLEYKDLYIDGTANIDSLVADTADINAGTIDGVTIGGASAGAGTFTSLTTSSTVTLNAGTANGVLYLNGSKVATSVSGFTFNGSTLSVGGNVKIGAGAASNSQTLMVNNPSGTATQIQLFQDGIESWTMGMPASSAGLAWAASGTEQMRLTSTGLGIGTSSPGAKLDVYGGAAGTVTNVQVGNASTAFVLGVDSGNSCQIRTAQSVPILFYTAATERMRLDASGNLGVGLAAASRFDAGQSGGSRIRFDLSSASNAAINYSNYAGSAFLDATHNAVNHIWTNAGSELARLTSTGNLGIGTSSPGQRLEVANTGASFAAIKFTNSAASGGIVSYSNDDFLFYTGNTERMRLDTSGNLGLGVTPSAWTVRALQVAGNATISSVTGADITYNAFYDGAWKYVSSARALLYSQVAGAGAHAWYTAPSGTAGNAISFTQAMTLDASGNLAVGSTASYNTSIISSFPGTSRNGLGISVDSTVAGTYTGVYINRTASDGNYLVFDRGATRIGTIDVSGTSLVITTNNTERARITSGGDLLVGTTSSLGSYRVQVVGTNSGIVSQVSSNAESPADLWNTATTGDNPFARFYTEGGTGTFRGSITYNRAGGLTAYNTASDYRAKDIIGPVQSPGATIDALKVYEGVMKGATQSRPMLIAHEAQAVAPYAVSGVKDEVNEDGTPKFQQIDVSSLVPLLLAEIQSLRARVAALESQP